MKKNTQELVFIYYTTEEKKQAGRMRTSTKNLCRKSCREHKQ